MFHSIWTTPKFHPKSSRNFWAELSSDCFNTTHIGTFRSSKSQFTVVQLFKTLNVIYDIKLFTNHQESLGNLKMVRELPKIPWESFQYGFRITENHLRIFSEWFANHRELNKNGSQIMRIAQESLENGLLITDNHVRIVHASLRSHKNHLKTVSKSPRFARNHRKLLKNHSEWFMNHQESLKNHFRMACELPRITWESCQNGSWITENWGKLGRESFQNGLQITKTQ